MTYKELSNKSEKDLRDLLAEKQQEEHILRAKAGERQLKNVRAIRSARLAVAQIKTALQAKKIKVA